MAEEQEPTENEQRPHATDRPSNNNVTVELDVPDGAAIRASVEKELSELHDIAGNYAMDWELRAGVDPLEYLQSVRAVVRRALAPLKTQFGSGGDRWTANRRRHRDMVKLLIVADLKAKQENIPAQHLLESMANAHPRHVAWVNAWETLWPVYDWLEDLIQAVDEKIEDRQNQLLWLRQEARSTLPQQT